MSIPAVSLTVKPAPMLVTRFNTASGKKPKFCTATTVLYKMCTENTVNGYEILLITCQDCNGIATR